MGFVFIWLIMALICAMIAGHKKDGGAGLVFFFYGLLLWPIALVHALLLSTDDPAASARQNTLQASSGGKWTPCQARLDIEYAFPEQPPERYLVETYGLSRTNKNLYLRGASNGAPIAFRVDRIRDMIDTESGQSIDNPEKWLFERARPELARSDVEAEGETTPVV